MNKKTLILMGSIALIVLVAAIAVSPKTQSTADAVAPAAKEKLYPGLIDQANDIARIDVTAGSVTMTTVRSGESWVSEGHNGYPASMEAVRKAILDLANMEKVEAKTSNPDNFETLEVREPSSVEGSASRLVKLTDSTGKVVAEAILGKSEYAAYEEPHQYVRKVGDNQVWLVKGSSTPPIEKNQWAQRQIIDIPQDRIKSVEIVHGDGERVFATRKNDSIKEFTIETMPEGRELKSQFMASDFSRVLGTIQLDDVAKHLDLELPVIPTATNTIETFDGLKILAAHYLKDDKKWTTIQANADGTWIDTENERRTKEAEEANAAMAAAGDSEGATPPQITANLIDKDKIAKEAADLNALAAGWAYQIPVFINDRLTRRNEYYLKELPAAPEPSAADSDTSPSVGEPEASGSTLPIPSLLNP